MQPKLPGSERERKLAEARQTTTRLITEAHQLPLDLNIGPNIANARRTLTHIKALALAIERSLEGLPEQMREFRE